jgi:SAM-dependent methyltransferase
MVIHSPEDRYRRVLLEEVSPRTDWLDLGCGWQLLRDWLPNGKADQTSLSKRARRLVGIDGVANDVARNPYVRNKVVGNLNRLPFADGSFSLVTAQMVIEHIENPPNLLGEVNRVLQPGGKFIFLTPNYLNYQVFAASLIPDKLKKRIVHYLEFREESDIFKAYYRMNSRSSIRRVAHRAGFSLGRIEMLASFEFRRIPPLHWIEKGINVFLKREALSKFRADILAILVKPR